MRRMPSTIPVEDIQKAVMSLGGHIRTMKSVASMQHLIS
jgi:hypothetical protein